ncbi:RNA polymerase factor sigma-54 [mine drainage metagenome]|uniref:RNA polymerase factor sigma-54 n=1 Tax=mine drainage metagenome TaxID=410659 RepID=A0A1J5RIU6_9ZZZZ
MLARFLELPLRAFDGLVNQVEFSTEFSALHSWVTVAQLDGAKVLREMADSHLIHRPPILGEVCEENGKLAFRYHRDSYTREYWLDDEELSCLLPRPDFPRAIAGVLRKLRLINTRNRLTHALIQTMLASQEEYLRSGHSLALLPLTQAAVSAQLRLDAKLSVVADPGRISRLIRGLSITLPNRRTVPLQVLFPKPRQIHCHFVDHVLKKEKAWMAEGVLQEPLPDEAIADILDQKYGVRLSRRTVAYIRHDLAIPDCRSRVQRMNYLAATTGFSALAPLTRQVLRTVVPAHSGVYEIRTAIPLYPEPSEDKCIERGMLQTPHKVLYIGSASDLRKRLGDHLRGGSDNALLYRHIADGSARVRFRLIRSEWRWVERELYRVFCETFGTPPLCNRMSP